MQLRVLITGAAGFIGSNLYRGCVDEGWSVVGVDDLSNGSLKFLPHEHECWLCDFADETVLRDIKSQQFDIVFHLAAIPRVGYSVEHPLETNDTNVSATLMLMEACRGNIKRFVFASSSSVYGNTGDLPSREGVAKNPGSPYALQKSIIEDYLKLYSGLYNFDSACMRFFNVFGPHQLGSSPYATAVSSWLKAIKSGQPMRSDGDGTQSRDMCYVDNVVDACIRAAKHTADLQANCFNVACGDSVTNNEVLQYLMKKYPSATKIDAPWRPGDVKHTLANISKAEHVLGYKPLVRFWEGLDRTIEWVENTPEFLTMPLRT